MAQKIRIWKISPSAEKQLAEMTKSKLDYENRLEDWIEEDISIIREDLLIIGRQVKTWFEKFVDILAMDKNGDVIIIELKKDKTPRDVVAQTLDYASWVKQLSVEDIVKIADDYFFKNGKGRLDEEYLKKYGVNRPDELNISHSMIIVASEFDESTERIVTYLSEEYGVRLNVLEFSYFTDNEGREFISRVYLIDPLVAETNSERVGGGKRQKNLSTEDLFKIASNNGVEELYQMLYEGLIPCFNKKNRTTRTSLGFLGYNIAGNKESVIISLIPEKSSMEEGVCFQLYLYKMAELFNTTPEIIESFLPSHKTEWTFNEKYGDSSRGFEGFFQSLTEVKVFVEEVQRLKGAV